MISRSVGRRRSKLWVALLPAALAAVLSSCGGCGGDEVFDLSVTGDTVHANLKTFSGGLEHHVSSDAGQSWTEVDGQPPPEAMRPDCGADGTCFRVVDLTIERETVRGEWEAVWTIPIEREEYVFAKACRAFPVEGSGGYTMNFTTDPVVVDTALGSVGIVGMGDQGVVVVNKDDVSRIGMGRWSNPNDFTGGFVGYEAEVIVAVLFASIVFVVLLVVHSLIRRLRPGNRPSPFRAIFISTAVWILVVLLPFELWARGVLDYYDDTLWAARIAGVVALLVLVLAQPMVNRRTDDRPELQGT